MITKDRQIRVGEETMRRAVKEEVRTNFIYFTPLQRSDPGSSSHFLPLGEC